MPIVVYGYSYCPYTVSAAKLAKVSIEDPARLGCPKTEMEKAMFPAMILARERRKHSTVPQCFDVDPKTGKFIFIGGFDDLEKYVPRGKSAGGGRRPPVARTRAAPPGPARGKGKGKGKGTKGKKA
eukprot:jgi/Tetstr1/454234/TSEL_041153.t1